MRDKCGWVWQERQTRDWVWVEMKSGRYFASSWITCADAVRILQGKKRAPETYHELKDISRYHPVSAETIELLVQTMSQSNACDE